MAIGTGSLSYDRLQIRCSANFVIFYAASALAELLKRRRKRSRKSRRRKGIDAADADDGPDREATTESRLRSLRFALFGALVHAPACSLFFGTLDAAFPGKRPREVVVKLVADRLTLAPALLLAALLWMRAPSPLPLVAGAFAPPDEAGGEDASTEKEQRQERRRRSTATFLRRLSHAADDAKRRLPRAYLLSCLFWVPAHSLGFAAVAARWRVLYVALSSLVWNVLLAGISTSGGGSKSSSSGAPSSSSLPVFSVADAQRNRHRKERWSG